MLLRRTRAQFTREDSGQLRREVDLLDRAPGVRLVECLREYGNDLEGENLRGFNKSDRHMCVRIAAGVSCRAFARIGAFLAGMLASAAVVLPGVEHLAARHQQNSRDPQNMDMAAKVHETWISAKGGGLSMACLACGTQVHSIQDKALDLFSNF